MVCQCGVASAGSEQDLVVGSCKHGTKPLGSWPFYQLAASQDGVCSVELAVNVVLISSSNISFIHFPISSKLEHRAPFGVSVITQLDTR
jgi:hypothetical protein